MPRYDAARTMGAAYFLCSYLLMCGCISGVEGHCFQMLPVSRQYYRTRVFHDGSVYDIEKHADAYNGGGPDVVQERTIARMDSDLLDKYGGGDAWFLAVAYDLGSVCPNGNYLETDAMGVGHGVCGDTPQSGDDNPIIYSTPNSEWPILTEYTAGSIIDIKVVFTNYHWGHIEFFLCDTGDMADPDDVVTQECFNKYPLDRALDDSYNSPVDPNYPGRYYIDPPCRGATGETDQERPEMEGVLNNGYINHMRYQLPDITCERCVLQMRYHSGRGCKSRGYDEFEPPSWPSECAPNKEDWIAVTSHECHQPGRTWGNMFWGCSDITLVAGDGGPTPNPPTPVASPAPAPTTTTTSTDDSATSTDDSTASTDDEGPVYLGCFADKGNTQRIMNRAGAAPGEMTTAMCALLCEGSPLFGTQYGEECWCGDEGTDHLKHGASEMCDFECEGNVNEICGGRWSMSVYEY